MGVLRAISDSVGGTLRDQWKDIITASHFDEHTVVVPGCVNQKSSKFTTNNAGSEDILSNGSIIQVPENTAAFVFSQSAIESVVYEPGKYIYQNGEGSIFNGDGLDNIFNQVKDRFGFGGVSPENKKVAFVNLREIRDIKFGTHGPQVYNDIYYGIDLEIYAYGSFSIKVVNPEVFVRNFVPANTNSYSFDNPKARGQILSEFVQSFIVALNKLSHTYRIAQLPSQANEISRTIQEDTYNAGTWKTRFGFEIVKVAIENIELSDASRELIDKYSASKISMKAYEDVTQQTSNIAAQQKIAQGIQNNGFGDGAGMILGLNMAQGITPQTAAPISTIPAAPTKSFDEQIEMVKKLKELVDAGILTEEEFVTKKKEILGL